MRRADAAASVVCDVSMPQLQQNHSFSCDGDMYGSYFAASAARAVCSYFRNEDTVILCVSPDIRLNPLNSLSAAHVSSRLHSDGAELCSSS